MNSSTRRSRLGDALGAFLRLLPVARYRVEGESMAPNVASGEVVIVNRLAYLFRQPAAGDLIVLRDPRASERLLIKRVEGPEGDGWRVVGDNEAGSTDSRTFGPVAKRAIIGKVWARY